MMTDKLERYLREAGSYLNDPNREDILLEIRAHIMEKAGDNPDSEAVERAVSEMPSARAMAASYAEGREIISPDLRNFLFLYTGVLFAIHLGLLIVASIAGTDLAVFPFFFAPAIGNLPGLLMFLPFAFIFDFGLISLFLFGVSQWAPSLKLPMPDVSDGDLARPKLTALCGQLLGLAAFILIWQYHGPLTDYLVRISAAAEGATVIMPAREIFILPLITMGISVLFTLLRMLSASRLLPALGSVMTLVALWLIDALVENPLLFEATGEPWDMFNRWLFKGLLILIALLTTLELVKHVVPLFTSPHKPRSISFRSARPADWLNTVVHLSIYMVLLVVGAIYVLPWFPLLWFVYLLGGLYLLVRWHNRTFGFQCARCGHKFVISTLLNLISPHGIGRGKDGARGWKWLRCPKCRKFSRATVVKKD